jgi:hypothetical protein
MEGATLFNIDSSYFEQYKKIAGGNPIAASILYFADRMGNELRDIDHQLCMGLRHGLDEAARILSGAVGEIATAIEEKT